MTSPSGGPRSGINLQALWVPILPETSQLDSGVEKAGREAKNKFETATRGMGSEMAKGVKAATEQSSASMAALQQAYDRLEQAKIKSVSSTNQISAAERNLEALRAKHTATTTQIGTAEQHLNTMRAGGQATAAQIERSENNLVALRQRGTAQANQVATTEDRLTLAKQRHESATRSLTTATTSYRNEQQMFSSSMQAAAEQHERSTSTMSAGWAKAGAVAGAMGSAIQEGFHLATEGLEKMAEVGKEAVKYVIEVGEAWEQVENQIRLHSTATGEELEKLNLTAERIAKSGAPVSLDHLGLTIATLHARMGDLDDNQLQQLATHIEWLGRKLGEPIDTAGFMGAVKQFGLGPAEADKALQSMMNTANASGVPINTIIDGLRKAGPAAHEFGLNIGQVGALMGTFAQAGIDPARTIMGLQRAAQGYAKDGIPLNKGLHDTIQQLKDLNAENTPEALSKSVEIANKVFGTRAGGTILSQINNIDLDSVKSAFTDTGTSIDDLMNKTMTLSDRLLGFKNRISEAIKPVGMTVVGELGGEFDKLSGWVGAHQGEVIGFVTSFGDITLETMRIVTRELGLTLQGFGQLATGVTLSFSAIAHMQGALDDLMGDTKAGDAARKQGDDAVAATRQFTQFGDMIIKGSDAIGGMKTELDKAGESMQASVAISQALGKAVVETPDEHTIKINDNSPEVMTKLHDLGIDVTTLPDGKVAITAETDKAKEQFEKWYKDTYGKEIKIEVKPTAKTPEGSDWNQSNPTDDLTKLFGIDTNNPLQIPAQMAPVSGSTFALPPGSPAPPGFPSAPGAPTAANPPAPAGPPPPPPPGVAGPTIAGAAPGTPLGDLPKMFPGGMGGGRPGRGGGAPSGMVPTAALGGKEAWRGTVRSILAAVGPGFGITNLQAWEDAIVAQIGTESGGNWAAKNNTDSNATAGHPSQGILQFIPGTYDTWVSKTPMAGRPFPDPYAEIAAAIPYVLDTYGVNQSGGPNHIGHGIGFQTGGFAGPTPPIIPVVPGVGDIANGAINQRDWQSAAPGLQKLMLTAWATQAARAEGVDPNRAVPALLQVISRESGIPGVSGTGNPSRVNMNDSNWLKRDPSIGLAQVTQGTANDIRNANMPGANLTDPVTNLRAALRHTASRHENIWNVPEAQGIQRGYDGGGHVDGQWLPGRDSIHAILEQGEWVTRRDRAQHMLPFLKWSNNAPVGQLQNVMGAMGYQPGGLAGDSSSTSSPQHGGMPNVPQGTGEDIVGWLKQIVASYDSSTSSQLQVTGDFPGGPAGHGDDGGQHSYGHAVDVSGPADQMDAFAKWWVSQPQLLGITRQLIHDSPGFADSQNVIGGQFTTGSQTYSQDFASEGSMVHLAVQSIPGGAATNVGIPAMPTGGGTGGTAGGGYRPSQYPGYMVGPDGKYVPNENVPNQGNYGGATQSEIDSALKARDSATDAIGKADQSAKDARTALDKAQNPTPDDYGGVAKPATPDELAKLQQAVKDADKSAADARDSAASANQKYNEVLNKPPETVKGSTSGTASTANKNVESLGGGLVKGALQGLGFDGSVFEDPTQWGIFKLFTSGVNWLGGMGKAIAEKGAPGLGIGPMGAGDGGGGGGLMSLLSGASGGLGLNIPMSSANASTVSTGAPVIPGAAASVSAPGTIMPGIGPLNQPGVPMGPNGQPLGALPGPTIDNSANVTVNGMTDPNAVARTVSDVQLRQSRGFSVGAPNGGLQMV